MEQYLRDYHVRRILSDIIPFEYNNKMYYISSPTAEFKCYAEIVYRDIYEKAKSCNISSDNVVAILNKYGFWKEEDEKNLETFKKELDQTKVSLYENYQDYEKRDIFHKIVGDLKNAIADIMDKRLQMNHVTAEHTAFVAKQRFLIGASILRPNKKRLWSSFNDWNKENKIIDCAFSKINENFLSEADVRDIVKNEPWRTIWSVSNKSSSLFKKAVCDLSDEQISTFIWSVVYDNIGKSQDNLSKEVIDDDDALDGWMILQRRKKETTDNKRQISSRIDSVMNKYETVFIVPKNHNEIEKIYDMNDFGAKMAIKQRLVQIQRDGVVQEVNMLDRRQQIAAQAGEMYSRGLRR
jgi:hypothetical protein